MEIQDREYLPMDYLRQLVICHSDNLEPLPRENYESPSAEEICICREELDVRNCRRQCGQ